MIIPIAAGGNKQNAITNLKIDNLTIEKYLIVIPIITGTVTTNAIFRAIPVIVISDDKSLTSNKFADVKTINGTEIMLIKLTTAVSDIDNATSPFANFVSTFDVTPPGAAAIIIKPMAISTGNRSIKTKIKATIGKRIN